MKKKFKLGVIGAGFMATAIINGAISSKFIKPKSVAVFDISQDALSKISKLKVNTFNNADSVLRGSEFILFAVKPQNFDEVIKSSSILCDKVITIMAGVKKEKIKSAINGCKVARCMPNTPCSVKSGAVGIDYSDYTDLKDIEFISGLFSSFAEVVSVSEDKLNAITGISGSSPAYFYLFIKGLVEAGIKNGLSENDAKLLATNTMIGAGKMIKDNKDKSLDELIKAVCSKGGTTIEAINIYNESDLTGITEKAVNACIKRAEELEKL